MVTPLSSKIVLPVFAGHGTTRTSLSHAADQAIRDADSPGGSLLLSSCLDAFLAELAALSPVELDQSGICPSDFDRPHRLLIPDPKYLKNHIISGVFLFLVQVLRYQSYVRTTLRSFSDILKANADHAIGVLGLSSGLFPACVVAASRSPLSFITTAVEIFRLVFWIALRVMQFTRKLLKDVPVKSTLPWSIACLGLAKGDIEQHIVRFEKKHCRTPALCVTTVLDERSVTVSGRPDLLVKFSTFMSRRCTIYPTTLDALYHSDLHLTHTRDQISADILERNIQFPKYQDLYCPLRSTISGDIVKPCPDYPSLVDLVVDMVLIHPVNWDLTAKKVASAVPIDVGLLVVNIGPGSSALRALEEVVPGRILDRIDATSDIHTEATPTLAKQVPIAIIGMAAHTPGAANTTQLWELLERGINTVSKIPDDRFTSFPTLEDGLSYREIKVETGNFMEDFADFDHKFFKICPREARSMDPQQRLLLHTAHEALESAGYVPDATPCFRRATFGCYIGAATHDYAENLANDIDVHYSTGTLKAFLSGRISYAMQFGGPSVVVDTACSSSIVAIHQACRALMIKDCDAALAGGVNVMTSPNTFVGLERGHFLSPSGSCRAFDISADGYSRSEGCGLLVLKRLSDAIAENDNILGVVRGVEVNQSGLASSITHPHVPTQVDLLRTLLKGSHICPTRVSVVEAHGTGTEAGDTCELASIRSALSQGRTRDNPLHVTSIKANIGHLEAASGAVGLCKLLLMLQHNIIPAQISLKTLHPLIAPLEADNTVIDTVSTPWNIGSGPRVAVLNNFGAAGSNGALILEEHIKLGQPPKTQSAFVFGISAKSATALERLRMRYKQWLSDPRNRNVSLGDIAYTATARRQIYPFRLAVTATDRDQLIRALDATSVTHVERRGGEIIFVFSGQGSQYLNMGSSLYASSSVFKSCIDGCQRYLVSLGYPGILPLISSGSCDYALGADEEFEARQCAVLAVEFALATLWKHWGVTPAGVIGQSLGEYAALVIADVLSIETALSIVAKRARLMSRACAIGKTGMISVALPPTQVQEILTTYPSFPNVTIACVNTESSCVVSGPVEELQAFAADLTDTFDCKVVTLQVSLGFHSPAMDPILNDLREHVSMLPIHPPSIPIASNVYGTVVPVGDSQIFQPEYFVKHCRQPVLFARGVKELEQYLDPSRIEAWIDLGPHAICLPMVQLTLSPSRRSLCLPSILKDIPAWDTLTDSLVQLYRTTLPVDWRRVFDECTACSCIELPSYPFESQKFWVPYVGRTVHATPEQTARPHNIDHPMLSSWSQFPSRQNGNAAIFETPISRLAAYMEGHRVGGYALCPASAYLELALAGAVIAQRHMELDFGRCMPVVHAVQFSRPLVLHPDVRLVILTHVAVHEDGTGLFSITSRLQSSREEHVHVLGDLRFSSIRETSSNLAVKLPMVSRREEDLTWEEGTFEVFTRDTAYEVVFPRVVEYAKDYHAIESLTVGGGGALGVARVALSGSLSVQPVFLDTLLHVAGFMANMQNDLSDAYICGGVGVLEVLRELVTAERPYTVYCDINWMPLRDFVTADVIAVQECDSPVVVAQLRGAQFRRVRLASLHRGLAMAANSQGNPSRTRTNSNAIIAPPSPRSVIFGRSRSNTRSILFCAPGIDNVGVNDTDCSMPPSPLTLVSEHGDISDMHVAQVQKIIGDVLGIENVENIHQDMDLRSLGLDSLGCIEAQQALRVAFNRPLPHNIFSKCPTVSALCDFLAAGLDLEDDAEGKIDHEGDPEVALALLQERPGSLRSPLYLVHDGSGLVGHYERLLPLDRDVCGISNPRFFCDEPWDSLEEMAYAYARAIEQHARDAAVILGGWSFGGVVAFEIARILGRRGLDVKGVVLIDSPCPVDPPLLSDTILQHVLQDHDGADASMATLVGRQFTQSTTLLGKYASNLSQDGAGEVPLAFIRATEGFSPRGVANVPTWFRHRGDDAALSIVAPWQELVGRSVPVWGVSGHHFELFSSVHVGETSLQVDRACRYLDGFE